MLLKELPTASSFFLSINDRVRYMKGNNETNGMVSCYEAGTGKAPVTIEMGGDTKIILGIIFQPVQFLLSSETIAYVESMSDKDNIIAVDCMGIAIRILWVDELDYWCGFIPPSLEKTYFDMRKIWDEWVKLKNPNKFGWNGIVW